MRVQRKVQKISFSRFHSLRAVPGSLIYFFLFDVRTQPFYCFMYRLLRLKSPQRRRIICRYVTTIAICMIQIIHVDRT